MGYPLLYYLINMSMVSVGLVNMRKELDLNSLCCGCNLLADSGCGTDTSGRHLKAVILTIFFIL